MDNMNHEGPSGVQDPHWLVLLGLLGTGIGIVLKSLANLLLEFLILIYRWFFPKWVYQISEHDFTVLPARHQVYGIHHTRQAGRRVLERVVAERKVTGREVLKYDRTINPQVGQIGLMIQQHPVEGTVVVLQELELRYSAWIYDSSLVFKVLEFLRIAKYFQG